MTAPKIRHYSTAPLNIYFHSVLVRQNVCSLDGQGGFRFAEHVIRL